MREPSTFTRRAAAALPLAAVIRPAAAAKAYSDQSKSFSSSSRQAE